MIMQIKTFVAVDFPENCYAAKCNDGIFLVDPGEYTPELDYYVKQNQSAIKYILLTHMHFDHIRATADIKKLCPDAKIVIHSLDADGLKSPQKNLAFYFGFDTKNVVPDILCDDLSVIEMGETKIKVLHTPGHTEGGVCYIVDDVIFSGDTLFEGSCGRTDFPGGNGPDLANSLKKINNLKGDYKVFSGHGNPTTLNNERKFNPYMRSL